MTVLVVGASGATGRLLVAQLLNRGQRLKVIVRSPEKLQDDLKRHPLLSVTHATLLELSDDDMIKHVTGCKAVVSCLGHQLSLQGIYGSPRKLVTEATRRLCEAIQAIRPRHPVRFVLMNTAGNSNRDLKEPRSLSERCVLGLVRLLLPPQLDNEQAADYLRVGINRDDTSVEWVVVRPDTLIDVHEVTEYDVTPSPIRSAIFNAGKTSRINVAHFMADLILNEDIWARWKNQMPVIYNREYQ